MKLLSILSIEDMSNNSILKLYHGSYMRVDKPDLSFCNPNKDFGLGFYLTDNKTQAEHFVRLSISKAFYENKIKSLKNSGFVSVFEFDINSNIMIKEFLEIEKDWLHYVVSNRRKGYFKNINSKYKKYDLIIGKIANDNTNIVINSYIDGIYGTIGTKSADDVAYNLLLPNKLKKQFCFKTNKSISMLKYLNSYEVKVDEKK